MKDKKGQPVPGKVSFIGLTPTHSPYFLPDNPVVSGQRSEGFKNLVYPPKDCLEVSLSAGTSLAVSSHGPEDTMELRVVEVLGAQKAELSFTIDKSVDTRRLVSVDSHIHTQNSNGYVGIAERLHSVMAEGVGVAVKANHNFITDYRPELERVGLASDLVVISGYEVTARTGSVHFIILPAAVRPGEPNNGAISVQNETPATLFTLARAKNPGSLVYINRPRSKGLGYFLHYELDPEKGASAAPLFDLDFYFMEAMNGAIFGGPNRESVEDWFHLLNWGYLVRIVGTPHAHGIAGGEPGYSRTYVLYDADDTRDLDQSALFQAMK